MKEKEKVGLLAAAATTNGGGLLGLGAAPGSALSTVTM